MLPSLLLFVSAAAALPAASLLNRDVSTTELATETLVQDVDNINEGVLALTAAIEAFPGTSLATVLVSGVEMLAAIADINTVNRIGYAHALASPQLNASESARVVAEVVDTVLVTIPNAVNLTESKKADFEALGLGTVIEASLELLIYDHDTFSEAVEAVLNGTPEVEAEGYAAVAAIHYSIQGGIDDFSTD